MNKSLGILLNQLEFYDYGMSEKRIVEETLRYCKTKRKEISKEEAVEAGVNIFKKRGLTTVKETLSKFMKVQ